MKLTKGNKTMFKAKISSVIVLLVVIFCLTFSCYANEIAIKNVTFENRTNDDILMSVEFEATTGTDQVTLCVLGEETTDILNANLNKKLIHLDQFDNVSEKVVTVTLNKSSVLTATGKSNINEAKVYLLMGGNDVSEPAEKYVSVSLPGAAKVFSTSMQAYLNLESVVTMSVGYKFEDMQDITPADYTENLGLLIWNAADAPKVDEATYENCENIIEGARYNSVDKRFETTTDGIAAKNLGDSLTFRAYYLNEDGTYSYSKLISNYSPKKYCYNQIKNYPDDTVNTALMASILNYGAEAQIYFNHDTGNLMNAELSEELKVVAWDASLVRSDYNVPDGKDSAFVRDSSITSRGGYLNLEGAIDYNFYAAVDFEPVSATICYWTEADVKNLDALKLTNASSSEAMKYNSAMSRYEGKYEGQPAKKMFETVFALMVFEKADGTKVTSGVVGYSPERYAYINYNKNNKESPLAKALAVYGDAARTYFEK